jgi:hypothetical protein
MHRRFELDVLTRRWIEEHPVTSFLGSGAYDGAGAQLVSEAANLVPPSIEGQVRDITELRARVQSFIRAIDEKLSGVGPLVTHTCDRPLSFLADRVCPWVQLDRALLERLDDVDALVNRKPIPTHFKPSPSEWRLWGELDINGQWERWQRLDEQVAARIAIATRKVEIAATHTSQHLELALAGSLGFWATIGLVGSWARLQASPVVEAGKDGVLRCFWANGAQRQYHDLTLGSRPMTDSQLFTRLARAVLEWTITSSIGGAIQRWFGLRSTTQNQETRERQIDAIANTLDLEAVAAGDVDALDQRLRAAIPSLPRSRMVAQVLLDNARRLSQRDRTIPVAAAIADGGGEIEHRFAVIRSLLVLPARFPAGSFLQAIGVLDGGTSGAVSGAAPRITKVAEDEVARLRIITKARLMPRGAE